MVDGSALEKNVAGQRSAGVLRNLQGIGVRTQRWLVVPMLIPILNPYITITLKPPGGCYVVADL